MWYARASAPSGGRPILSMRACRLAVSAGQGAAPVLMPGSEAGSGLSEPLLPLVTTSRATTAPTATTMPAIVPYRRIARRRASRLRMSSRWRRASSLRAARLDAACDGEAVAGAGRGAAGAGAGFVGRLEAGGAWGASSVAVVAPTLAPAGAAADAAEADGAFEPAGRA